MREQAKCQGGCASHSGEVLPVVVNGFYHVNAEFDYCEVARESDKQNGFSVEVLKMSEQAKWKIEVGETYKTPPQGHISYKVTRVEDGVVFYEMWCGSEPVPYGYDDCTDSVFRKLVIPADASPVKALREALTEARKWLNYMAGSFYEHGDGWVQCKRCGVRADLAAGVSGFRFDHEPSQECASVVAAIYASQAALALAESQVGA